MMDVTFEFPTEWALCPDTTSPLQEPAERLGIEEETEASGRTADAPRYPRKSSAG